MTMFTPPIASYTAASYPILPAANGDCFSGHGHGGILLASPRPSLISIMAQIRNTNTKFESGVAFRGKEQGPLGRTPWRWPRFRAAEIPP